MFLAMNRFQIAKGYHEGFEKIWREHESFLSEVPNCRSFALLRGPERKDHVLYSSHTVWASRGAFTAWTESDHFLRRAHAQASGPKGTYLAHLELETFEAVLQE